MSRVSVLFTVCLLLFTKQSDAGRVRRIVNGKVVEAGKLPIAVSMRSRDKLLHMCGGTLISEDFVLTAAHCILESFGAKNIWKYIIRFENLEGVSHNRLDENVMKDLNVGVQKIYVHDEYDERTNAHDIALMKLNTSVKAFDSYFEHILPNNPFGLAGECQVYGYGKTDYSAEDTSYDILRTANVRIVSPQQCTAMLTEYIAPKPGSGMVCALGDKSDACQGDSGSSLMCSGVIEGIVSYGMGCIGVPGVYTKVVDHIGWIYSIIDDRVAFS